MEEVGGGDENGGRDLRPSTVSLCYKMREGREKDKVKKVGNEQSWVPNRANPPDFHLISGTVNHTLSGY